MKRNITILLLLLVHWCAAQRTVPPLWGHRVHDEEAHVLSTETIEALESQLAAYEDSTSNQIVVLIISSLQGEVLEEFALRVAHKEYKLGQEGKDNGVLLLISVDDRKIRIEVGYGLEGVLPDAITSRIIRNESSPRFREHNYDEGVKAGVNAIIAAIGGEYTRDEADDDDFADLSIKERLLIGAFVFGILGIFTFIGLFVKGCGGWFLYAFLIPFYATFPMVVAGASTGLAILGAYIIGFPILKSILGKTAFGQRLAKGFEQSNRRSGRGWTSGSGWLGGGGGGWSSGGGGFSGGGGGFGGGGSSGSW